MKPLQQLHRTLEQIDADTTLSPVDRLRAYLHLLQDHSKGLSGTGYMAMRHAIELSNQLSTNQLSADGSSSRSGEPE